MSLDLSFGFGVNKAGQGALPDYALEFNGTDEYLQIALPAELVTNGNFETNVSNWTGAGTFTQVAETGKQGNFCAKWEYSNQGISPTLTSAIVIGQKYKVKLYYKSTTDLQFRSNVTTVYTLKATSEWNYASFVFTAVSTNVTLVGWGTGTAFLDNVSIVLDQGFDLNKDQEQILHSKNWDFERTLGTELNSGTVTIGSKYVVTAGTVEGNAVGTEFLAVTNATTLDSNNKVKEIPNLVTNGTCEGTYVAGYAPNWTGSGNDGTSSEQTGVSGKAQGFTYTSDINSWNIRATLNLSYISGKRYRITFNYTRASGTSTEFSIRFGSTVYSVTGADGTWKTYAVDSTASSSLDYLAFGMKAGHYDAVWAVDNVHIYEIPEWTASGNHTCNVSIIDKSGTGANNTQSMLVSASGAGNTSNCVTLPSANLESCVSGKKYTIQGEGRLDPASLTYGVANIISDSGFDNPTSWLMGSAWSVSGSQAICNGTSTADGAGSIGQNITGNNGEVVKITFDVISCDSGSTLRFYDWIVETFKDFTLSVGTMTIYIGLSTGTKFLQLRNGVVGKNYVIDNLQAFRSTTNPTITAQLGTKSVISSALSIVAGTFTKFVLNFEWQPADVTAGMDLKLYLSGAGSVFVDKLSLTQAYDSQTYLKIKPTETAKRTVYNIDSTNFLEFRADGKIGVSVSDGTNTVTNIAEVAYTPNEWIELLIELNRTGNVKIIKGTGTPTGTAITTVGKIIKTSTTSGFRIGANASAGETVKGQITKMIRTRYDNLTGYSGSEEMLRVTFQDGSSIVNCLKDYSPKGHTVSGVLVDITNRKRVTR